MKPTGDDDGDVRGSWGVPAQVDRLFDWRSEKDAPIRQSLEAQKPHVVAEFEQRLAASILNLNEQVPHPFLLIFTPTAAAVCSTALAHCTAMLWPACIWGACGTAVCGGAGADMTV